MKISKSVFLNVSLLSLGLLYGCGSKDSAIVASPSPVAVVSSSPSPVATPSPSPSTVISSPKPVPSPTVVSSVSESTPEQKVEATPADKETSGYVAGTCKELRAMGLSDFRPGDPNYSTSRDRDNDGIACESGASTTPKTKVAEIPKPKVEAAPAKETSGYVAGTCKQLRAMGLSDFRPGDPNYSASRDRDRDGIACESR